VNVDLLIPKPTHSEPFRWSHEKFVPAIAGCYALCSAAGTVLYVGLADNLRRRMGQHLSTPEKIRETSAGRAVLFYWIESDEIHSIERAWMNTHIQHEGALPVLNAVFSPVG
jgi:predicted GIY-YIG superfamily endonuclease